MMNSDKSLLKQKKIPVSVLLICFLSGSLNAAALDSIDSGQLEKRFEKQPQALSQPRVIQVPETDSVEAPPDAESISLTLGQLIIEGVTAYPLEAFEAYYKDKLNRNINLKQIYEIASLISRRYGDDGYLLSRAVVPPQTIENGEVLIQVLEGYIDKVTIKDMKDRPSIFQNYMNQITADRPLKAETLERYLLLANDLSGVSFRSVLNPSSENIGAASLILTPTLNRIEASATLDNRGSEASGPWQLMLEATANNLFGHLERTTLSYATVPNDKDELLYLNLHHSYPVNGEGVRLDLDVKHTRTEPGLAALNLLSIETEGDSFGASLYYPVMRSREENLSVSGTLDFRSSKTLRLGSIASDDQLRAVRLGASYDRSDSFAGGGVNLVNATLVQGIDMMDAQVQSRNGAEPDFGKLELRARRNQYLAENWTLDVLLIGQLAEDALPASEQYGLGSENSVRGYEPAEWTGDNALAGNIELRYLQDTSWADGLQYYAFYDHGKVWRETPAAGETTTSIARATGLGVRMDISKVSVNIEADRTLRTHADGEKPDWGLFGHLRINY